MFNPSSDQVSILCFSPKTGLFQCLMMKFDLVASCICTSPICARTCPYKRLQRLRESVTNSVPVHTNFAKNTSCLDIHLNITGSQLLSWTLFELRQQVESHPSMDTQNSPILFRGNYGHRPSHGHRHRESVKLGSTRLSGRKQGNGCGNR